MDEWPVIECPHCADGTVTVGKVDEYPHPYYQSDQFHEVSGDPTEITGTFSATLVCGARGCGQTSIVVGDFEVDQIASYGGPDFAQKYTVRGFYPAVCVVETTDSVPPSVRAELDRVGALVWSDPAAATTAMRASVERLLDDQGVSAVQPSGGFRSLNERIKDFKSQRPEVGELLNALKKVGNEGTHGPTPPTRKDVLDVVGIIETAVELLYVPSKHATAHALAARINAGQPTPGTVPRGNP